MDIKEFAKSISGKEYGYPQFTEEEIITAKENGFVIVYGASDDLMEFEKQVLKGSKIVKEKLKINKSSESVYMLTNFDTTIEEDLYRIKKIEEVGFRPDVRIYRKNSLPQRHILRDLQRWCNNRILYNSCDFMDYVPRSDGKKIREIYF